MLWGHAHPYMRIFLLFLIQLFTRSSPHGDQAARWPPILCSICVHSFGASAKRALLKFSSISNRSAAIWKRDFSATPSLGLEETLWSVIPSYPTHGFILTPYLLLFRVISLAQKAFPSVRPRYDDRYHSRSYRFVQLVFLDFDRWGNSLSFQDEFI